MNYLLFRKPFLTFVLLFIFLNVIPVKAAIKKVTFGKEKMELEHWEVLDIEYNAKAKNPFNHTFYAEFVSDKGKKQKVPGFYNGNNQWILRFSSGIAGEWTYTTISDIKSLNGKTGTIKVNSNNSNGYKGSIVIPENDPRHFYYENGEPYFLMAFECDWLYALDYHDNEATPKTEHLLSLIKENGFNQVVMNVFSYDVKWWWGKDSLLREYPQHEFGSPKDIFPFLGSNENPDFSSLNPEFFQKLDRTIALMHDKNIVSHLMIYVWNKMVAWPHMNTDADNLYFDYVVKRYGAFPNIMWDISKEALHYERADDAYILDRINRFRENNYFNRTLTVHDYEFCVRNPESVDYFSRQDWTFELYNNMMKDYHKYSNMPIFNIEHGGYEESPYEVFSGAYRNAEVCLRRNYQCAFAGAYSTYYWQGTSWNAVIWNPFEQPEHFYKPKFEYFKHMTHLFTTYEFSEYVPMPEKSREGYSMKHKDKESYLMYAPKEVFWYVPNAAFKAKTDTVHYKWFNTYTGEYTEVVEQKGKKHLINPWYGKADAVLIMWKEE